MGVHAAILGERVGASRVFGYGAFSVSQSQSGRVQRYIASQEEHHRRLSFQDELRQLLKKHGIEFDERYVWD
jgi:putative transposase